MARHSTEQHGRGSTGEEVERDGDCLPDLQQVARSATTATATATTTTATAAAAVSCAIAVARPAVCRSAVALSPCCVDSGIGVAKEGRHDDVERELVEVGVHVADTALAPLAGYHVVGQLDHGLERDGGWDEHNGILTMIGKI